MLEGVKVIEMATYVAAPSAGGIMSDWGADIVKSSRFPAAPCVSFTPRP